MLVKQQRLINAFGDCQIEMEALDNELDPREPWDDIVFWYSCTNNGFDIV